MAASRNISVSEASRPKLPRHAKLKFDETRQVWVILAPERVLAPDEIAVEVLQLCDGVRSVADMVDQLAAKYAADREAILTDVIAMLQDLADKGFLTEAREKATFRPARSCPKGTSDQWLRAATSVSPRRAGRNCRGTPG